MDSNDKHKNDTTQEEEETVTPNRPEVIPNEEHDSPPATGSSQGLNEIM